MWRARFLVSWTGHMYGGEGGAKTAELEGTGCRGNGRAAAPAKEATVAATRPGSRSTRSARGFFVTFMKNKSMTVSRSQSASMSVSVAPLPPICCHDLIPVPVARNENLQIRRQGCVRLAAL